MSSIAPSRNACITTPSRTVVTSFNPKATSNILSSTQSAEDYFEQGDWVYCVEAGLGWIACGLSSGEVQVYDEERLHLRQSYRLSSQDDNVVVTDLAGDLSPTNELMAASTKSGSVHVLDCRTPRGVVMDTRVPRQGEEALSVSVGYDGTLLAVGSSLARIHFFDLRSSSGTPVGTYSQSHTKEITQVRFQKITSNDTLTPKDMSTPLLMSGSEDGLICLYDTSKPSEEAAISNVISVGSPVRRLGFFGANSDGIYCQTGSESVKLFAVDQPTCQIDCGVDLRNQLSHLCSGLSQPADCDSFSAPVEYLVGCHWDHATKELLLLAGGATGDAGLFSLDFRQSRSVLSSSHLTLRRWFTGGHRGVVRDWVCTPRTFFTVGEDARLCEWSRLVRHVNSGLAAVPGPAAATRAHLPLIRTGTGSGTGEGHGRRGGGPLRRQRHKNCTTSPY